VRRYYFHIHDRLEIRDEVGTELVDLAAVQLESVRFAGSVIRELGSKFWDSSRWQLEVLDDAGGDVLRLDFMGSLSPRQHPH